MKKEDLTPMDQGGPIGQALDLASQISYHRREVAPHLHELAEWERKEYLGVYADYLETYGRLVNTISNDDYTFNRILKPYGYDVVTFEAKLAQLCQA